MPFSNPFSPNVRFLRRILLLVGLVLICSGCGRTTYPVNGTVVWQDGSPAKELAGGSVEFESGEKNLSASGEIRSDGSFTLTTFKKGDGAPPGTYKVLITEPVRVDANPYDPEKLAQIIPKKYRSFKESKIEITVKPESNTIQIKLAKAK